MKEVAAYGTWHSRLSGDYIAQASIKLSEPCYHRGDVYFLEGRPSEKGRQTIVRRRADGTQEDLLQAPLSARSKVHEYGGGCYCLANDALYFCNAADQQVYRSCLNSGELTPVTDTAACRYADLRYDPQRHRLIAVCEDHIASAREPQNRLVAINLGDFNAEPLVIDDRHDFVASPRLSPCGSWLVYISWDHPSMPWDASQLWLTSLNDEDEQRRSVRLAGATANESIAQPQWSPSGSLFWVSDRSNWWNLYSLDNAAIEAAWRGGSAGEPVAVHQQDAEYATPQWVFNMSSYGFLSDDEILAAYTADGYWHLQRLCRDGLNWRASPLTSDLVSIAYVHCTQGKGVFAGATATSPIALYEYADGTVSALHAPAPVSLAAEDISVARGFCFPTSGPEQGHAFFYPPTNLDYSAEPNALPPVIVIGHGGPTGATDPSFSHKLQYWTQRGFAVVDVNYRGSTGFGRRYRQALQKQWGLVDVADLSAAAEFATAQGWVHPQQRIIRGSSAGGYSVLAALTDTTTFNAGVTLYGIGDLETLVRDTHKFESRYLDGLIGPYPEQQSVYRQRSPIHKVGNIRCPVLVFQGGQDKVVPPNQAEEIVDAVKRQGLPVAYMLYPEEGHGFRSGATIAHQLQAELYFYQQVFALDADGEQVITIDNWGRE